VENVKNESSTVILGNYKSIKAKIEKTEITDKSVEDELERILSSNSKLEEVEGRKAMSGDTVTIDFEGFADGVAFEGGKGSNVDLELGSNTFIPGFEDQIIGKDINDSFDIKVKFPDEYQSEALAGKDAIFKTVLNKISLKKKAKANDQFAQEIAGAANLDEFKKMIHERLENIAKDRSKEKVIDQILAQVIDSSEFTLKDEFITNQAEKMKAEYTAQLNQNGWSLDNYLKTNGQTIEQFDEMVNVQAKTRAKSILVVNAIAKAENISVTDEDMEIEYENIAQMHQIPLEDLKKRFRDEDLEMVKWIITSRKVFDFLIDSADID